MRRKTGLLDLLKTRRDDIGCVQKTEQKGVELCETDHGNKFVYNSVENKRDWVAIQFQKVFALRPPSSSESVSHNGHKGSRQ